MFDLHILILALKYFLGGKSQSVFKFILYPTYQDRGVTINVVHSKSPDRASNTPVQNV